MNRDLLRSHQNRNCQMILPYRFAYSLVYMKATWIWVLFQNHPIVSLYFFQWLSIWRWRSKRREAQFEARPYCRFATWVPSHLCFSDSRTNTSKRTRASGIFARFFELQFTSIHHERFIFLVLYIGISVAIDDYNRTFVDIRQMYLGEKLQQKIKLILTTTFWYFWVINVSSFVLVYWPFILLINQ